MSAPESLRNQSGIQTASGYFFVCLGLFFLVVGITYLTSMLAPPQDTSDSGHELIAKFLGDGEGSTGPFTVSDHWEFRWEHEGHLKRIRWIRSDGVEDMFLEMPGKPIREHGGINYEEGGEYRIYVEGEGPWKISVYQFGK